MIDYITHNAMQLTADEQDQLFKVVTENAELFDKVMPDYPLIKLILHGTTDSNHEIIQAYVAWKSDN